MSDLADYLFSFCSVPTAQALESIEWPRSLEERDDIQKPARTIEVEIVHRIELSESSWRA